MASADVSLKSQETIDRLFQEGVVYRGTHLVLVLRSVEQGPRRVLFVASRKVGNAVRRNRAKRLMREAYRSLTGGLVSGPAHFAWIARPSCAEVRMPAVRDTMVKILTRARFLRPTDEVTPQVGESRSRDSRI